MPKPTLASLKPNARNPRKITEKQLYELKRSLEEFGDLGGIVVNADGTLISGHQRFEAMKACKGARIVDSELLGAPSPTGTIEQAFVEMPSGERFTWRRVDWPEQKATLAMLAANKQGGSFDVPLLADTFAELDNWDVDLDLTGFSLSERDSLFAPAAEAQDPAEEDREGSQQAIKCPSCGHEWHGR